MLVAYGDLICQLPQSVGLGMYGTNTMFLTVFFSGGREDFLTVSADVVATPIMFESLLSLYIFLCSAYSFTDKRSLQSE